MKFQPESLGDQFVVQRYDEEGVVISGRLQTESVVFGTDFTPRIWENAGSGPLTLAHCEWLFDQCPPSMEVLLIGTGPKQVFPAMDIRRFFVNKRCPVEYMDSQAACRTYNILIGEGRHVVAAILL